MWQIYIYVGLVSFCLAALMINLILNLRSLHRLDHEKGMLPSPLPLISVLIPARNEESNIGACLESLQRQDYPDYEILVLDDDSSDNTSAIVEEIAASDPRVRLLRGSPLPEGWAGKTFACHQLASQARGSWLLFTDADTVHSPSVLRDALAYAHNHSLSLLSGLPLQRTVSLSQKVVIPALYFVILSCFPLWWLQGSKKPKPGLAIGQFLFVSASDYHEIGGHEAVKSRIIEDVCLGFEMVRHGKRQGVVDLSHAVSTEMCADRTYRGVGELWQGFTKFTYSVSCFSTLGLVLLILGGIALFLGPFILIAWQISTSLTALHWFAIIVADALAILMMRALIDHRFGNSEVFGLAHPAAISFMLLSGAYATYKHFRGTGVSWKRRAYNPASGIR
jgi:chlorobactene glucosyltransferase